MKVINPSYAILTKLDDSFLKEIELAGRTCYKSEDLIKEDSDKLFCKKLIERKHEAMIEFGPSITVRFICNRGFTHEMVRHRLCSFAQESTRYCNYSKDKYDNEITFILPPTWDEWEEHSKVSWENMMSNCENCYKALLYDGRKPQEARGVLPIDVKTEIVVKTNIRDWRHIFQLRTSKKAHPSMQQLMRPLLEEFKQKIPTLFDDIIKL